MPVDDAAVDQSFTNHHSASPEGADEKRLSQMRVQLLNQSINALSSTTLMNLSERFSLP